MPISRHHLAREQITSEIIKDGEVDTPDLKDAAVTRPKTSSVFIQTGEVTVSFPFAAAGVERIDGSVTFITPFPSGVTPRVFASINQKDLHITGITNRTNTGFTITLSDSAGVDKTAAVSVVVTYLAIAP